jgi:TetR/AcrR family transcriptional regulator, acrAB operon repressor
MRTRYKCAMARGDRSTVTRETLLQAGARVFTQRGLHGATVREIVDQAGLTIPALYYHFSGKEDLYSSVVRDGRERFRAMMNDALALAHGPAERLRQIANVYVRFGEEDPVRLRVLCAELFRSRAPTEPDQDMGQLHLWTRQQIETVLQEGVQAGAWKIGDVGLACRLFISCLVGLLVAQAREPGEQVLDSRLADRVVELFLYGAGAH